MEGLFDAGGSAELFVAYGVSVESLFGPKSVVEAPFPDVGCCAMDSRLKRGPEDLEGLE